MAQDFLEKFLQGIGWESSLSESGFIDLPLEKRGHEAIRISCSAEKSLYSFANQIVVSDQ